MKRVLVLCVTLVIFAASYLCLWPTPVDPLAWQAPLSSGLVGEFAPNNKLGELEQLMIPGGEGPEDIAVDDQGRVYAGMMDGRIVRFDSFAANTYEVLTNTGGRPLGLAFDQMQNLIIADSYKGLLALDQEGKITILTNTAEGVPFKFTDDVDVAQNGIIYFTDASSKFGQPDYKKDAIEHRPNGRFLSFDPATRETKVLLRDLYFPNGVAVSADQTFVLVNESWNYSIRKFFIAGPNQGASEFLIENLPGFPDGISRGSDGVFWVGLPSPRDQLLDDLADKPFVRKIVARLPEFLQPATARFAWVLGIDRDGKVIYNLQDPNASKFAFVTSVEEAAGYIYLGSLKGNVIARLKI